MITAAIALFTGIIGLLVGAAWREVWDILKRIQKAARVLIERQDKVEKEEKRMSFAEPAKWEEMDDQERIEAINQL